MSMRMAAERVTAPAPEAREAAVAAGKTEAVMTREAEAKAGKGWQRRTAQLHRADKQRRGAFRMEALSKNECPQFFAGTRRKAQLAAWSINDRGLFEQRTRPCSARTVSEVCDCALTKSNCCPRQCCLGSQAVWLSSWRRRHCSGRLPCGIGSRLLSEQPAQHRHRFSCKRAESAPS